MKNTTLPAIIALFVISGCATYRPYAQNPFNITANISPAHTTPDNTGKVSDSTAFRAANLGLAAVSRPIPGTLPHGAGVGIATALLLGSGKSKPLNTVGIANYLTMLMPVSEAENEGAAQLKMGSLVENAIIKSIRPLYKTRVEEYDDTYWFGRVLRPRWIRVDGPFCENWSCQITGPIPTANSMQWEGEAERIKGPLDGNYYYRYSLHSSSNSHQTIGFVKITNEYDKGGLHFVEAREITGFDYEQFYQRISENLPEWVGYRVVLTGHGYMLRKGKKEDLTPKS